MRSRAALRRYAIDDRLEVDADPEKEKNRKIVLQSIQDHVFWNNLDDLRQVLGLLHEEQVKSESGKAHIGYVIIRWHKIEHHLRSLQHRVTFTPGQKLDALFSNRINRAGNPCSSIWETRFNKQVMDIHWAAYHLDPAHQPIAMTQATQANVLRYMLKTVIGNAENVSYVLAFSRLNNKMNRLILPMRYGPKRKNLFCFGRWPLLLLLSKSQFCYLLSTLTSI